MTEIIEIGEATQEIIEVSSARGPSATIVIGTVIDAPPDTATTVTNSGTSGEMVLDFVIRRGDSVELRINEGYLQWKTTTAESWNNILPIADITPTIQVGTVTTGVAGTDVAVTNSGVGKDAVFNFAIPRGDSVELRIDSGYIQWKGTVDETWNSLYAISAITPTITVGTVTTGNAGTNVAVTNSGTGKDGTFNFTIPRGDDVQLRIDSGYLQWKNTTASTWTNIIQITDITATITVGTVTTGAAGTDVTFVNAGSGKDAIFNLSIPKGTTFTPSVSAEGVISFTNDGGLTNPTSVNIKGDKGDPGNLTGPASSVNENIPIFDGIAGDKLKDSGVKLSDKADVDDVANALALKADIAPITTYTHTANKEAHCTAVDISTNVFTSNIHTLVDGDMVWAIANEDAGMIIPLNIYPGGITHMAYPGYYVGVVDANSFKLYTDIARTTEVDITANANMDLSKMHFETKQDNVTITGLNAYKYKVVINGKCLRKDAAGGAIGINNSWTTGVIGINNADNNVAATIGNGGDIFFEGVFDLDSTKTAKIKVHTHTITTNNTTIVTTSTKDTVYFKQSIYNTPITSIVFSYCYLANGTKIEVYKA